MIYFSIYDNKTSTFHGKSLLLREQNDIISSEKDINYLDSMIEDEIDQYIELIDIIDKITEKDGNIDIY